MSNNTTNDWADAEAVVVAYMKTEKHATDPIEVFRFESTPFLFGVRWPAGEEHVLVYDGKVQLARGVEALLPYLAFLGETRIRAIPAGRLDRFLAIMGASARGPLWRPGASTYEDLFPAIVESNGVLKYVVNWYETPPPEPPSGTKATGPLVFHRYSLQLFPVVTDLKWKHEERFERPPILVP